MPFDIGKATEHLVANKATGPTSKCAAFVRQALVAGGLDTSGAPVSAKSYGAFLLARGFTAVPVSATAAPQKGDIVVIQPYQGGSVHGHIAMYSGTAWISDFQQNDMWGGPGYRKARPAHVIYRYPVRVAAQQ